MAASGAVLTGLVLDCAHDGRVVVSLRQVDGRRSPGQWPGKCSQRELGAWAGTPSSRKSSNSRVQMLTELKDRGVWRLLPRVRRVEEKSHFLSGVNADKAVLDSAAYADFAGRRFGSKAEAFVQNGSAGSQARLAIRWNGLTSTERQSGSFAALRVAPVIDVTSQLIAAMIGRDDWSHGRVLGNARAISVRAMGYIDWDQDAGEEWIRIIVGARVCTFISTAVPLGFLSEASRGSLDVSACHFKIITVPDMNASVLACAPDVLRAAFGESAVDSPALDADCFSAEQLWFATVS